MLHFSNKTIKMTKQNNFPTLNNNSKTPSFFRLTLVGLIGNVMEWYDFAVYGYFAVIIGQLYFPSKNPTISLIASFGAFAAGFLARPLGGIIFGRIGDLVGRQRAMLLSVITMAVPTVMMGLLPTYESIGILAPILLVLLRLIQGLSVGGEYTSSLIFMVENAPPNRRAFSAVWGAWGASAGILLGSGVGYLMNVILTINQLHLWGWRIPFILGGGVAFFGFILRRGFHSEETLSRSKSPTRDIFTVYRKDILRVILLNIGFSAGFYTLFVYTVNFLQQVAKFSNEKALRNNSIAMVMLLIIMPIAAKFADKYGRKKVLGVGFTLLALTAVPLFHVMGQGIRWVTLGCQFGLALPLGIISGAMAAINVELMPRDVRCTGLAFSYNLAVGIFGGVTPLVVTWLTDYLQKPSAPGYWVAGCATISALTLFFFVRETRNTNL
jgi:MHS family proline/betaine transporter-like MFS transporter